MEQSTCTRARPSASPGRAGGSRYLCDSARPAAPGDTGSARWRGHSRPRARSRSAAGSPLRGNPGDSLAREKLVRARVGGTRQQRLGQPSREKQRAFLPEVCPGKRRRGRRAPRSAAEHHVQLHGICSVPSTSGQRVPSCLARAPLRPWGPAEIRNPLSAAAAGEGLAVNQRERESPALCDTGVTPVSCAPALRTSFGDSPRPKPRVAPPPALTVLAQGPVVAGGTAAGPRGRVAGGVVQAGAAQLAGGTEPPRRAFCGREGAAELLSSPTPALQRAVVRHGWDNRNWTQYVSSTVTGLVQDNPSGPGLPNSQDFPVQPGAHEQEPSAVSQSPPLWQEQGCWQPTPYRCFSQPAGAEAAVVGTGTASRNPRAGKSAPAQDLSQPTA